MLGNQPWCRDAFLDKEAPAVLKTLDLALKELTKDEKITVTNIIGRIRGAWIIEVEKDGVMAQATVRDLRGEVYCHLIRAFLN